MSSFPIPNELIVLILDELDVPSLLICMQVCKQLQSIIQQNPSLLYKICLFSGMMSDVQHCNWDLPSRLEAIRRHTDAWNNLHFPTRGQIPWKGGQAWDLVSGILAQSGRNGGISCVQMPCSVKGTLERRWVVPTDFRICDFTIDISQDLLVAIELGSDLLHATCPVHVHLRSCTTGMVHPKAAYPRITPEFFTQQFSACFLIRACGPYVGILFDDRIVHRTTAVLAIWDWRTGSRIMLIRCPEFHSFAFISDELLLVTFVNYEQVSLRVLAVIPGNFMSSAKDVQYLCELRFPILRARVVDVSIISEPSPTSTSPNILAAPFTASTDVLFTVTLMYAIGIEVESAVVLLVPRSTILHQLSRVSSSPQKYVGWESWGETGSRMLDIESFDIQECCSYGMKFIHSPDGEEIANVYDLNPHATRKDVNVVNPHLPWKAMEETEISGRRNPFQADVVTSLPGREAFLDLIPNEHGWVATMITEDHIVMVYPPYGHGDNQYAYMAM